MNQIFDEISKKSAEELRIKYVKEFDGTGNYEGIKAITFDGLDRGNLKTKCFAYIGFPQNIGNTKVPAVVLIHGGAGYPFLQWVKEWTNRGYAAISLSTIGVFPLRINAGDVEGALDKDWTHELTGVFYEDGYTSTPDNDDMRIRDTQPIDDMWMYHAVSQVLFAGKVLESFDVVDSNKIGAVGISWGSVILSVALGYKNNFAYAIPVYGSGYLSESLSYMRYKFILPRVQDLWLAEKNFNNVKIPVLWICMNNDSCFSANSNSKSYIYTVKNNARTTLSIKSGWIHGHSCCWDINYPCKEIYAFADAMVGEGSFPYIEKLELSDDGMICAKYAEIPHDDVAATLYYLTEQYEYAIPLNMHESHIAHNWKKKRAFVDRKNRIVRVNVPSNATVCYLEIVDKRNNLTVSSIFI